MTSFNNFKVKLPSQHPWERIVKDKYSNQIKYGHNSINNPPYPRTKEKLPDKDRLKITIIGNRVTEEFNYCVNLVKGLHKYRWKNFDSPIIKGVTTVEWPKILNDLKLQYGGSTYCLSNQVAVLINNKFLGGEKELKDFIETKYTYHIILDYYKEGVDQFSKFINSSGRPCAYMHISINDEHTGTLIFMLYADLVPYTCENFLNLCKTTKGGYSGTPIHRIVKDGWIQCGGFGLKGTNLDCENFIMPHDRRGVICMANDGRHVDCSTQFFVLLQPAPWMARQYVAFGQLIDGESTLKAIESVPTWYESPKSEIIMYQTGILNLECQDIMINKGTIEYIHGHIEDLVALGDMLYEELMEKVFLLADLRYREKLIKEDMEEMSIEEDEVHNIRETQRFIRKKEDMDKLQKSQADNLRSATGKQVEKSQIDNRRPSSAKSQSDNRKRSSAVSEDQENKEFDVEVYEYEPEEEPYKHISLAGTPSLVVKPDSSFYIALTDVPYPGDVDSTFDLKKMLRGDYCLESDLQVQAQPKRTGQRASFMSEMFRLDNSEPESNSSLGSDDELEIKKYLKHNVDRVSFAGSVVRNIARGVAKFNIFEDARKSELITDEELRRFRIASVDRRSRDASEKKVSIAVPDKEQRKIKRRQTGFLRPEDLERLSLAHQSDSSQVLPEEEDSTTTVRKVRIAPSAIVTQTGTKPNRRQTGLVRPMIKVSDIDVPRPSTLSRLYDEFDVSHDEEGPTLKDYKTVSEVEHKYGLLTYSPNSRIKSEDSREKYLRHMTSDHSYEHALVFQHGKKVARKISSDYVKTIDQMQHKAESSIRSVEFARTRPCISVSEYQMKNLKYYEENKSATKIVTVMPPSSSFAKKKSSGGLRLPGDTPVYSMVQIKSRKS
ncbi:uncharacterized protein [Epargyreus clarus]|uniref:uncharacterized protein n=1 Tax=Epargyreus clarus TaxID=520877 RepID=UPI003C3042FB